MAEQKYSVKTEGQVDKGIGKSRKAVDSDWLSEKYSVKTEGQVEKSQKRS